MVKSFYASLHKCAFMQAGKEGEDTMLTSAEGSLGQDGDHHAL